MSGAELIKALRRLKVETGALACLGCGHEHNCGTQGCAILRDAIAEIEASTEVVRCPSCKFHEDVAGYHECKKLRMRCPNDAEFFCKYGQRREDGDGA